MKNTKSKLSWRILHTKEKRWINDSLLFIRTSVLCNQLQKMGIPTIQLERLFQSLGMDIEKWQIKLIIKRYANKK